MSYRLYVDRDGDYIITDPSKLSYNIILVEDSLWRKSVGGSISSSITIWGTEHDILRRRDPTVTYDVIKDIFSIDTLPYTCELTDDQLQLIKNLKTMELL